jgi:curved DNA-binding protein CbpA
MSDERLEQLDYYTLLGVQRTATIEEIKRAFRTFARKFHPDRFAGAPADKVERATRIYRRGSEAVQTLTDLESRRAYDIGLGKGELRLRDDPRAVRAVAPGGATGAARRDETGAQSQTTLRSPSARAFFAKA